jgi:hypothetical protein
MLKKLTKKGSSRKKIALKERIGSYCWGACRWECENSPISKSSAYADLKV